MSSVLQLVCLPVRPSATVALRSDSMAPNMAIVNAGGRSWLSVTQLRSNPSFFGNEGVSTPKRSPMVRIPSTPQNVLSAQTTAVTTTIAVSAPGSLCEILGVKMIRSIEPRPTRVVARLRVPKCEIYTSHLPRKSPGIFSLMVSPKKSGIWVEKMVRAIPAVKPTTIGYGINLMTVPR